ncbi:hypothetical protein OG824_13550 [Streptomyces prunicolor]|uniref:hypothetical protein n=1 Tax=Streptomyces prunicolor TaxID=67348 RepID=UPI002251D676|nr:hypothetical protein [Streptomyces prunicolor]MCX5236225.1 hypothetical protein [Streptomyces prunicolor]
MTGFEIAWAAWAGAFVVIEGIALYRNQPGDTLSEQVWRIFGTRRDVEYPKGQPDGLLRLRRFALVVFLAWLSAHFLTGGLV